MIVAGFFIYLSKKTFMKMVRQVNLRHHFFLI